MFSGSGGRSDMMTTTVGDPPERRKKRKGSGACEASERCEAQTTADDTQQHPHQMTQPKEHQQQRVYCSAVRCGEQQQRIVRSITA